MRRLERIGPPPYTDHHTYVKFIQMVSSYGGGFDLSLLRLFQIALRSPEYNWRDYLDWIKGANRGSGPMWSTQEYLYFNACEEIPQLQIPVYFFAGVNDMNTPLKLVQEYVELLKAPQGKELVLFYDSAHTPFFAETEKFDQELRRVKERSNKGR